MVWLIPKHTIQYKTHYRALHTLFKAVAVILLFVVFPLQRFYTSNQKMYCLPAILVEEPNGGKTSNVHVANKTIKLVNK